MTEKENKLEVTAQPENNENLEKINKLKALLDSENSDLFEILSLQEKITFEDKDEEEKINNIIWQRQYSTFFPQSPTGVSLPLKVSLNMINLLLTKANKYKIKDTEKINQIKYIQEEANNYIKEIKKMKSLADLNNLRKKTENIKVDINEYFIQKEMKLKNKIKEESDEENSENEKDNLNNKNK